MQDIMMRDHLCNFLDHLWHTHILFLSVNDTGEFVAVNTAFCALLGYTQQDLIGSPLTTVFKYESSYLRTAREQPQPKLDPLQPVSPYSRWLATKKNQAQLGIYVCAEWLVDVQGNTHKIMMLAPTDELTNTYEQLHFFSKDYPEAVDTATYHLEPALTHTSPTSTRPTHQLSYSKNVTTQPSALRHVNLLWAAFGKMH
jgi:hypothetical protein